MKFAIVTDSHIGPCGFYRGINRIMSNVSENVLCELAETINRESDISFISQLGDLSQDDVRYPNVEFDRANFKRALWYFQKFNVPVYHAVGNHDRENLNYNDLCELLNLTSLHYSFDANDVHCVFLYTRHFNHQNMTIESDQLEWLKQDLATTKLKTLVFMHHPVSDQDLKGNFWFDGSINKALVSNRAEVREIFIDSTVDEQLRCRISADGFRPGLKAGKYLADLYAIARLRLLALGVVNVTGGGWCTHCDTSRFYSYRRDGVTGRMASVIGLRPSS